MEEKTITSNPKPSYSLFSLSNSNNLRFGFGMFGSEEKPLPPPPPCVEVFLSEGSQKETLNADPVVINDSLTLYKGRVSTAEVFGLKNSDLVPGKYEGGLKLWEGSIDLIKILCSEVHEDRLLLRGKRVLELGCGHGLPGIFTGREGAALIHFQDFNAEVLRCLTMPNVKENLMKESPQNNLMKMNGADMSISSNIRFFAGDWSEIHKLLLSGNTEQEKATDVSSEQRDCNGYDIILMAETVYAISSLHNLYSLIKKCLHYPHGVVYMAAKKYYFGVGGGTRQFLNLVEEDGAMDACLLAEVADGSSNVREVWKLSFK
ncbi:uncharacterized protein [Typha latifolia]|uniref:uncharacterized protein isoform X1 n=1 Tax=Typha latifolia TaxID=4733 RepID=UPI003C3073E8